MKYSVNTTDSLRNLNGIYLPELFLNLTGTNLTKSDITLDMTISLDGTALK